MAVERRSQVLRRDFLVGAAAGAVAVRSASLATATVSPEQFPKDANSSYAQCGEDVIVRTLLEAAGIRRATYLDIGAYLPAFSNNTYLLYRDGGRGVLIEPNVDLIGRLEAGRPLDRVLNVGIGVGSGAGAGAEADYYRMSLEQWNTFDRAEAERAEATTGGRVSIREVVRMRLVSIDAILAEYFPGAAPDFLSIDVEGLDLAILRTLDFGRFRPRVICAETLVRQTSRMNPEVADFLATQGYRPRAMTFANTIFVDGEARPA